MQRNAVQRLSLLAVVIFAIVLRVYQLKDVPAGFFCDEAAEGYNAYAIGTTGIDESGIRFPLFIWSFGGYKNPIYIYSDIIPIRLFGLDEFTTRLPAAVFGVGGIVAIFFLGRALFTPWVGLFAAVFLAVCPWHLHFSRIAFDMTLYGMLAVIGFTLLVRFTQGRRTLPAALFFFGSCLYAYAIATLFVPLFLLGFGVLYLPTLWRRWRETLLAGVVALATVAPAGVFNYAHPQGALYFRNTTMLRGTDPLRVQAERYGRNYLAFFSRSFLFSSGDPISRHSVRGFGELLPFYAPFLLLGAAVVALRRDRASKLVLWWLALYPGGASLMTEIPSATRAFIGAPAFCLLTGIGFAAALRALGWLGRWRPVALTLQTAAVAGATYALAPEVMKYLQAYFIEYPKYSAPTYGGFQYGYRDSIHYMESQRANYDLLMLTAVEVNQPQIFPLFYNRIDPHRWNPGHTPRDLGYLISDPAFYADYSMNQRVLYQLRESDLQFFNDYTIHKRIVAPGGQVEFVIAEVRERRHFLTDWLGLGLFANDAGEGVGRDFIDILHPTKDRYKGSFDDIYWRRIGQRNVRVDLNGFYASSDPRNPLNPENVCAYVMTALHSPTEQSAFLELAGSDDYVQVWLNGRSLMAWPLMLSPVPKRRPIDLTTGKNVLMLKSCEGIGDWYFTARITDADGHDIPDITARPEIPQEPIPAPPPQPTLQVQLIEGFESIVSFKHTQNTYADYRGGTESWWTYVSDPQSEVVWHTAPCPEKKRTVFLFTASTSPEAGEAELFVNGKYALTFNLSNQAGTREWKRGGYQLTFVSKGEVAGNSGVVLVDMPADQITAGEPVELRVTPVRGDDHAWFMVKSYRDTIAHEHMTPDQAVGGSGGGDWKSHTAE